MISVKKVLLKAPKILYKITMKLSSYLSERHRAGLRLFSVYLALLLLHRTIFFSTFSPGIDQLDRGDLLYSLYLGLKFDLRVAALTVLPFFLLSATPYTDPYRKRWARWFWLSFYTLISTLYLAFLACDIGYYEYLNHRLSFHILEFTSNLFISLEMVWQTYPVVWVFFGLLTWITVHFLLLKSFVFKPQHGTPASIKRRWRWCASTGLVVLLLIATYGKLAYYPLRWSEAYFGGDRFVSAFALNPIHNFFDTKSDANADYDIEKVRQYYPVVADYLGVENLDADNLNFTRIQKPTPLPSFVGRRPNIVVIFLESLSAHRSGLHGNPMGATEVLDQLGTEGWVFDHFYTPSEGTARGIFAVITGLTDINKGRTSSRNQRLVEQNTAANVFEDYHKYYFIGGSANWGNIRGVLTNNIKDLNLIEEGMFESPRTDVWGISDYHLFLEAHETLESLDDNKPFLAFIQTAGFHRPYSIPADRGDFKEIKQPEKELKKWGFKHNKELNSLRFADYSLGEFMKRAKSSKYFDNTIFILFGDHGLPDNNATHLTPTMIRYSMERFHTPLVFYGPRFFEPKRIKIPVSQVDILPTLAAITGNEFINKSLGRNIFDPRFNDHRYVMSYVYYNNPHQLFLFNNQFMATGTPGNITQLYNYKNEGEPKNISLQNPDKFETMSLLLNGLYYTSKYLLYNNKHPTHKANR